MYAARVLSAVVGERRCERSSDQGCSHVSGISSNRAVGQSLSFSVGTTMPSSGPGGQLLLAWRVRIGRQCVGAKRCAVRVTER